MTVHSLLRAVVACASAALIVVPSAGQTVPDAVEISDDGRLTVRLTDAADTSGSSAGSGTVPFNLVPDWQNNLRRQVGGLQVADMNGDGLLDVVAGCYSSNSFPPYDHWYTYIYYNIGGALEATPSWISTDEVSTGDVQVGFINDDAYLDIFAANGGAAMSPSVIYFGSPTGPSQTPGWASADNAWNNHAILIDIDHDGDMDVVTANQGNSQFDPYRPMFMFRSVGGVLPTTPSWQSLESSIQGFLAAGDLDGDGWEDIAVSKWINFESGVYRNLGGTPQTTPIWTTGDTGDDRGVAWSDVDGDGDLDLALGHDPTQLYTNTAGALALSWSATAPFFGQQDFRFADIDGDGDDDLLEIHFGNGHANIYLNESGVLAPSPSWTYDSPSVGTAIAVGDINGDGHVDLVVGNSGNQSILVFYNTGPPPCFGDLDGSGSVGFADILQVIGAWGPCAACPEDLDGSGDVGFGDILAVIGAWGPC